MENLYCPNCQKQTGFKRAFGIGTLLACIITGGLWIIALPFYPVRCSVCGGITRPSQKRNNSAAALVTPALLSQIESDIRLGRLSQEGMLIKHNIQIYTLHKICELLLDDRRIENDDYRRIIREDPPESVINEKICPYCAETIKKAAIVCKHCHRDLPTAEKESA